MSVAARSRPTIRSTARWRGRTACCPTRARSASSSTTTRCTRSSTCRSTTACRRARGDLGARPYLSLAEFRAAVQSGRIADRRRAPGDRRRAGRRRGDDVLPGLSRAALWRVLLLADCDGDDAAGLDFAIKAGLAEPCQDPRAVGRLPCARLTRARVSCRPTTRPCAGIAMCWWRSAAPIPTMPCTAS